MYGKKNKPENKLLHCEKGWVPYTENKAGLCAALGQRKSYPDQEAETFPSLPERAD